MDIRPMTFVFCCTWRERYSSWKKHSEKLVMAVADGSHDWFCCEASENLSSKESKKLFYDNWSAEMATAAAFPIHTISDLVTSSLHLEAVAQGASVPIIRQVDFIWSAEDASRKSKFPIMPTLYSQILAFDVLGTEQLCSPIRISIC